MAIGYSFYESLTDVFKPCFYAAEAQTQKMLII